MRVGKFSDQCDVVVCFPQGTNQEEPRSLLVTFADTSPLQGLTGTKRRVMRWAIRWRCGGDACSWFKLKWTPKLKIVQFIVQFTTYVMLCYVTYVLYCIVMLCLKNTKWTPEIPKGP